MCRLLNLPVAECGKFCVSCQDLPIILWLSNVVLSRIQNNCILTAHGIIETDSVASAMKAVDRADYCKHSPYQDSPQGIGYGVTISAPHMVPDNSQFIIDTLDFSSNNVFSACTCPGIAEGTIGAWKEGS